VNDLFPVIDHAGGYADLATQMRWQGGPVVADSACAKRPLDNAQQMVSKDGNEKVSLHPPGQVFWFNGKWNFPH